ncbi:MAG: hypothetical protein RQ842_06245 [Vulcanisaeta sp.]|nr:hypothetical protein [Vulcanisaeta sp.]
MPERKAVKAGVQDPAPWALNVDAPKVGAFARRRREPIGDEESRSQMRGTGHGIAMIIPK